MTDDFKETLRSVLKEELSPIHQRLEKLESDMQEMKAIQQRHDDMIHQLIQIVGSTNAKVETMDKKVQALDEKVQTLDAKVQALDEKVQTLDAKVQALDEKVQTLDARVQALDEKVQTLDARVQALDEKVQTLDARVQALDEKVQTFTEEHHLIQQAVLETSDTVKRIETTLENHDRTLYVLSRRSIEQEAELKRIAR